MKKVIKIYLLILTISVISTIGCSEPRTHYYDLNSINLSKLELYNDFGSQNFRPTNQITFSPLTFGVNIDLKPLIIADFFKPKINFISSAYAFSNVDDIYILNDNVSYIKITTINDFDENHLAGSDVTEYFNTIHFGKFSDANAGINTYLNNDKNDTFIPIEYHIYLRKSPTSPENHQFQIEIKFESGRSLTDLTDVVILQ